MKVYVMSTFNQKSGEIGLPISAKLFYLFKNQAADFFQKAFFYVVLSVFPQPILS